MISALIHLLSALLRALPARAAWAFGRSVGAFLRTVIRYHRTSAEEALRFAFPDRSEAWRRNVLRSSYANMGLMLAESLRWMRQTSAEASDLVVWEGREHLDAALQRGRGAMLLCAHLGNWELVARVLAYSGYRLYMIVKPLRPAAVNDLVVRMRERSGARILPSHNSSRAVLRALRDGGAVCFVLDQNMIRTEGLFVRFLNRWACTTPGLAHLASASGAPIVPCFSERRPDGSHVIHVLPAMDPPKDRVPESLRAATQQYVAVIEAFIREHPEQWIWVHRRWRTQPRPEDQLPV